MWEGGRVVVWAEVSLRIYLKVCLMGCMIRLVLMIFAVLALVFCVDRLVRIGLISLGEMVALVFVFLV